MLAVRDRLDHQNDDWNAPAAASGDGTVQLDDLVGRWLVAGPNGAITLRRLATHTSGLPEAAPNYDFGAADPLNPQAGLTAEIAQVCLFPPPDRWVRRSLRPSSPRPIDENRSQALG